jgi:sugar/nucleoside kinase (ribokinase family)
MKLNEAPVNVFVLGDLVVDHFIPTSKKTRPFQRANVDEVVVEGHRRRTFVGGAANCARLIASLGAGRTCLWGLSGHSPWGSFVQLLDRSQNTAPMTRGIIYLGVHNEAFQMNTITRVIREDEGGGRNRLIRIDDIPYVHVTESQERDALDHLRAEAAAYGLQAIILNDLDMGALSEGLVRGVIEFASEANIPVFVDPKRNWAKYRELYVTCALPNLREWCDIIGESDRYEHWRTEILASRSLESIAHKCLQFMPRVDFHVITCDSLGSIVILKSESGQRDIYHIKAHPVGTNSADQLGPGDILVAALAIEFVSMGPSSKPADRILPSLEKANAVVACYMDMNWHQTPSSKDIAAFAMNNIEVAGQTRVSEAHIIIPESQNISMDPCMLYDSELVSVDPTYRNAITSLVTFLLEGWNEKTFSAILTGRGGTGKSEIIKILQAELPKIGVFVRVFTSLSEYREYRSVESLIGHVQRLIPKEGSKTRSALVIIDEAFTVAAHLTHGKNGVLLLQEGAQGPCKIRFMFIDANYEDARQKLSTSQFESRCKVFRLPSLDSRHIDIPYVFAAACFREAKNESVIRISETALLKVVDWVLKTGINTRTITQIANDMVSSALRLAPDSPPELSNRNLPDDVKESKISARARNLKVFEWARFKQPAERRTWKRKDARRGRVIIAGRPASVINVSYEGLEAKLEAHRFIPKVCDVKANGTLLKGTTIWKKGGLCGMRLSVPKKFLAKWREFVDKTESA